MKLNDRQLRRLYIAVDWATTSVAWLAFNYIRFIVKPHLQPFSSFYCMPQVWGGQVFFPLLMLCIYWFSGYYNQPRMRSRAQDLLTTLGSATIGALLIFFLAVVNDFEYRRSIAIELVGVLALLLFLTVYVGRTIISWRTVLRHTAAKPLVMVGTDPSARKLADSINRQPRRMGYHVADFVDPDTDDILRVCADAGTDAVVVSPAIASTDRMPGLLSRLLPADLSVLVSPGINEFRATAGRIGNVVGEPLVDLTHARVSQSTLNVKRTIDVACSALALIILFPLMASLAIAVKCSSPGPIFYKQKRMGRRKREFTILKFRSMRQDAELTTGPTLTRANDPRITPVGRLMRKYRLDELPQFINIIIGDMSLVGPRPERRIFADQIAERVPLYSIIYQVRPGLTSWGMVKYGYASSIDQMVERLRYDLIYMENISLATDLKIMLHTIKTVFTGRGQ